MMMRAKNFRRVHVSPHLLRPPARLYYLRLLRANLISYSGETRYVSFVLFLPVPLNFFLKASVRKGQSEARFCG